MAPNPVPPLGEIARARHVTLRMSARAVELLETGMDEAFGIALLEHDTRYDQDAAGFRPVKGLRAPVHGHWPVEEVVPTVNRGNIDTGAEFARLNRLIFLEVNSQVLRSWTFDVDEFRVPGSAERIRLPPPGLRRRHEAPVR